MSFAVLPPRSFKKLAHSSLLPFLPESPQPTTFPSGFTPWSPAPTAPSSAAQTSLRSLGSSTTAGWSSGRSSSSRTERWGAGEQRCSSPTPIGRTAGRGSCLRRRSASHPSSPSGSTRGGRWCVPPSFLPAFSPPPLFLLPTVFCRARLQNVHAIGDRANHAVLNGFAASPNAVRPRLEHAQILTPEDLQRVVDLGVIASYQPTHATSDMSYAESKIGGERIKTAYAWQSVLRKGGRIGSFSRHRSSFLSPPVLLLALLSSSISLRIITALGSGPSPPLHPPSSSLSLPP